MRFAIVILGGLAAACSGRLVPEDPPLPFSVPPAFSVSASGAPLADRWWLDFDDPSLGRTVERALAGNLGLQQALARLEQAEAVVARTGAGHWPEVTAEGSVAANRSVAFLGDQLGEQSTTSEQLLGVFAATYELDLWQRVASQKRAAEHDREATREDLDAARVSLVAEVTSAWFDLLEADAQQKLLAAQETSSARLSDLVALRFGQGLATAPEVLQQRQQVASIRSQMPPVKVRLRAQRNRLAVLAGRPPGSTIEIDGGLPEIRPVPSFGLPAELLKRRPDVRASRNRVAAADARVAAAIAERFPALRLTGRTGWQGFEATTLPENWIWTVAGNLVTPILDGGRRRAEVRRTEAVLDERLASYGETVLRALEEAENALVEEEQQRERVRRLGEQVDLARATLRESRRRYVSGLVDYLSVLTALQTLQTAEREALAAKRDLLLARVGLYRALGGSFHVEQAT